MLAPAGAAPAGAPADRRRRRADPRSWSLALRVVLATTLMATIAVLAVGTYLSSVIADGLFEQRRDQALEDAQTVRQDLVETMRGSVGATSTQTQDTIASYVQSLRTAEGASRRDAAIVPVEASAPIVPSASDRSLFELVDGDLEEAVAGESDALVWRSVGRVDESGRLQPQILIGTRVAVPGSGSVDLYLLYSLRQEQQTLTLVQRAMAGGGLVLLGLVVGIAVVVARLVTVPLQRAAGAAERIAAGDLASRMEVTGGDELAKVGRSFNAMAENLEEKVLDLTELSRVQQRFVSDVSHELRTPLTTIRMATSVLEEHRSQFPPDLERTTELLSTQVRRFDTLLADLLEISRFDAGAATLEARTADLNEIAAAAVENARPIAEARGSAIELRRRPGSTEAVMDPRRIDRILRNLLTNAIEHGEGGPIQVLIGANEQAVAVLVQDFGSGIRPEDAARVFDRFWRADPSRARTLGGTGLGLAISSEDAHLHGGWLQAWGLKGAGAVFRLTLPRRPGGRIEDSPLPLERSFSLVRTDTGAIDLGALPEEAVRPDSLPDLRGSAG